MTTEEMITVLQAYQEGKTIEALNKAYPETGWYLAPCPCWNFQEFDYRIKEEPKYVPFEAEDLLVGKIVKNEYGTYLITGQEGFYVEIKGIGVSFTKLLAEFKFLDGSPCGKLC